MPPSLYTSELSGSATGSEVAEVSPTGIVIVVPSASVTTNGVSVTALSTDAVYVIVVESSVIAEAVKVTVVVSIVSAIFAVALGVTTANSSKFPPVVAVIVAVKVSASLYTSES